MSYDKIKKSLNGPVFPIITPFKDKSPHEVDYGATCDYIDFLYDSGVRNFYIMTYNSRFSLLSWDEMKKLNEVASRHIKNKPEDCVIIVADPLTNPTSVSVDFAKHPKN